MIQYRGQPVRHWLALVCLVGALLPADSTSAQYAPYVAERYVELLGGPHGDPSSLLDGNNNRFVASMAGAAALLWTATGDDVYRDAAMNRLELIVADYDASGSYQVRDEFFMGYPLLTAYQVLRDGNALPSNPAFHNSVRELADKVTGPHPAFVFGENQSASRTAGMVLARDLFPELDQDGSYTAHIDAAWDSWYDLGDTVENSPHYNRLFLESVIAIAERTGRTPQLASPGVELLFRRMREHVTPAGLVSAYGDDDGVFAPTQDWPLVFEYAAQLYGDPGYRWAAANVHQAQSDNTLHPVRSAQDLFWLAQADQYADDSLPADQAPAGESQILMRKNIHGEDVVGQLVLTPGRGAGAPYVMADLFGENYAFHPHPEQLGALAHYESEGTVYLRHYARNRRATEESNSVLIADNLDQFPFRDLIEPGQWQEAVLPTSRIVQSNGLGEFLRELARPNFRVDHASGESVDFFLDHLRLVGPEGEVVLDSFENSTGVWGSAAERTTDAAVGNGAIKFPAAPGSSFHVPAGSYDQQFDIRDYDELRFAWKIQEGAVPALRQNTLIFRTDSRGAADMNVEVRPFDGETVQADVEPVGGAQYADYTIDGHMTKDTQWTRQTLLLDDGPLVVVDSILAGKDAQGKYGGPLWHLNTELLNLLSAGDGWFAADGFASAQTGMATDDRLYVTIADSNDADVAQWQLRLDTVGSTDDQTVYAAEPLTAGHRTQFVSLLVPFDSDTSPHQVHEGASIDTSLPGQVLVTLDEHTQPRYAVLTDTARGVTTMRGDLNLDGTVQPDDLLAIQDKLGSSGLWTDGDFDVDGQVSLSDYQLLRAALEVLPGDYNFDGSVDSADYLVWKDDFGSSTSLVADGNANAQVDSADYIVWRNHQGLSDSQLSGSGQVPEPTPAGLAMICLVCLAIPRRTVQRSRICRPSM